MLTLGIATFVALWPWMWFDFLTARAEGPGRLGEYLSFHWNHPYYNMEFFGHNYFRPPFPRSYPYMMILFTVPAVTLVLFFVGFASRVPSLLRQSAPLAWLIPPGRPSSAHTNSTTARATDDPLGTDVLFFGAGYAILALWLKPNTPIFGGTKHWFPAYPFLALFAGAGFEVARAAARATAPPRASGVRFGGPRGRRSAAVLLAPSLVQTAHSHPFGLSQYTPLAGGTSGRRGLRNEPSVLGLHHGLAHELLQRARPAGGRGVHPRHGLAVVGDDAERRALSRGHPRGVGDRLRRTTRSCTTSCT